MKPLDEMAKEADFVGYGEGGRKKLERFAALVREDEREACAKLCQDVIGSGMFDGHQAYAAAACRNAIRARGE